MGRYTNEVMTDPKPKCLVVKAASNSRTERLRCTAAQSHGPERSGSCACSVLRRLRAMWYDSSAFSGGRSMHSDPAIRVPNLIISPKRLTHELYIIEFETLNVRSISDLSTGS